MEDSKPPKSLATLKRWIVWKYDHGNVNEKGKPAKPPIDPETGKYINAQDSNNWMTYGEAMLMAAKHGRDGVGFVLGDGWAGVDLDNHYENGEISAAAQMVIEKLKSYTEISPSGAGIHILVRASSNGKYKDEEVGLEVYGEGQYFTFTGREL